MKGDLTDNFSRKEFKCQGEDCCDHSAPIDIELVNGLQVLWLLLDQKLPVKKMRLDVTSGFRCNRHNKNVGGAKNSMHPLGKASDVSSPYFSPEEIAEEAATIPCFAKGGIGISTKFVHVDVRKTKKGKRWRY